MKRNGTFYITNRSHGITWWLTIGWWWRPTKYVCAFTIAKICGFKYIETRRI